MTPLHRTAPWCWPQALGHAHAAADRHVPKPLVQVAGKALIDHVLDRLADAGVERAVVNVHHFADQIERHLSGRDSAADRRSPTSAASCSTPAAAWSRRCRELGDAPFFHVNSDTHLDRRREAESRPPRRGVRSGAMDALLLLAPIAEQHRL